MRISDWSSDVCSSDLIGTVTAFHQLDLGLGARMLAEHLERLAATARARPLFGGFGELHHRGVHAGFEHLGGRTQPGIFAVMLQIWPVTPDRGFDWPPRLGMIAAHAGQAAPLGCN